MQNTELVKRDGHFDIDERIKNMKYDDLLQLTLTLVQQFDEAREEATNILCEKGYLNDSHRAQICMDVYCDKLYESIDIIDEFNEYGGGPSEEEQRVFDNMDLILSFFQGNHLPDSYREECIQVLMEQYLRGNSGFDDVIMDWIWEIANQKEHWYLILNYLKKSESGYHQSLIMQIYKDKLNNDDAYEKMRLEKLEYGMDYYDYVQFLHNKGEKERALKVAEKGLVCGKGRLDYLYEYVFNYYNKKGQKKQALELLYKQFRENPNYKLYKQILDYADKKVYEKIKRQLYDIVSEERYSEVKVEIDFAEGHAEGVLQYVMNLTHSHYYFYDIEKYEKFLIKKYPDKMIDYYQAKVEYYIRQKKRKFYKVAATNASHIQHIYVHIMDAPEKWDLFLQNLLTTYSRLPALQDEFKKL